MTMMQKETVGAAVASLVLGILGLILIGPLGSIPAVICGHMAKARINRNPEVLTGDGMALAGLILGYIQIGVMIMLLPLAAIAIPSFVKARNLTQQSACVINMRQISTAKECAAMEKKYVNGTAVSEEDLSKWLRKGFSGLTCPKGGRYTINPIGQDPVCSEHGALSDARHRKTHRSKPAEDN